MEQVRMASFVNAHRYGRILINHDGGFPVGMGDLFLGDECLLKWIRELFIGQSLFDGVRLIVAAMTWVPWEPLFCMYLFLLVLFTTFLFCVLAYNKTIHEFAWGLTLA